MFTNLLLRRYTSPFSNEAQHKTVLTQNANALW